MKTARACGLALALCAGPAAAETTFYSCEEDGARVMRSTPCRPSEQEKRRITANSLPPIAPARKAPQTALGGIAGLALANPSDAPDNDATPPECRFRYYRFNDKRGAALAQRAKEECLQNIEARAKGRPSQQSLSAYQMWRDHYAITTQKRSAPSAAPSFQEPARQAPAPRNICRPGLLDEMDCRPR